MLVSAASTAADIATTTSVVKLSSLTDANSGDSSTPASPAIMLQSIHDAMLTRSASIPASSVMRGLSTTARMRSPRAV